MDCRALLHRPHRQCLAPNRPRSEASTCVGIDALDTCGDLDRITYHQTLEEIAAYGESGKSPDTVSQEGWQSKKDPQ